MPIFQISVDQSSSKSSSTSINPFLSNFLSKYTNNSNKGTKTSHNDYNDEDTLSVDAFSSYANNLLKLSTEYYLPSHSLSLSNVEIETKEPSFPLKRNKENLYQCQSLIDLKQISDFHSKRPVIEDENEHLLKQIENDIEKFADNKNKESISCFSNLDSTLLFCNSLSFDTNSGNSLERFFNSYQIIDNSLLSLVGNCQKFPKSSSIFYTSPVATNHQLSTSPLFSTNKMNVASKKRGLFGRSTAKNVSNNLSSSINEHEHENGTKLKSAPLQSSPSGTSHHLNELDEERFNGDGVMFQGKLIGHEYVAEARGEQMCQQSLKKLKIIQKALGGHKRKINMFISFDGIKITDPNSNEELFHHAVPQISFISRDETDTRAFGYVFGNSQTGHQFIGIKSKKEAMVVMSTIGQLFAITLKRKRNAEESIAVTTTVNSSITQSGEEHLYHSVQDQRIDICNTNDFSMPISSNKTGRIRNNAILSGNAPIPALPPPTEQHPKHRQNQQINRFATVGRINDQKNSVKTKQTSSLINELDLFQPITNQDFDSSKNKNNLTASSCDWAHFDDDNPPTLSTLSQAYEDSTLNTISSISDTLTATNNTITINDSVTLVEGGNTTGRYPTGQNANTSVLAVNKVNNSKLNVSSTTISSANFDGMDPFSDAFGADDPFSNISTTADISSNVFSNKINSQINNRPPSNPGPNTMFDSNKLSFKNIEAVSGSVPLLANSLGSITLDGEGKQPKTNMNSNTFKSTVELSSTKNNPDKYAVLHDINSISTSIFDSLGSSSGNAVIECGKQITTTKTTSINDNWQISPPKQTTGSFNSAVNSLSNQSFSQPIDYSSQNENAPKSFCNVSYNQQNSNPINFGANGIVVLPPVVITSSGYTSTTANYCQQQSLNYGSDHMSKNFQNNFSNDIRQPPKAEFDSMSNLSSTSSNASSSNNNQQNTNNNATTINQSLLQTTVNNEKKLMPIFHELDPLKKTKSPLNDTRNRSPLPNLLDSSLSSINSSNSSLFNSRNCSTPNSLHRKSPQLLSQHSLPTNTSKSSSKHLKNIQPNQNNSLDLVLSGNQMKDTSTFAKDSIITNKTNNSSIEKPNPHYIMLCNLSTAVATNSSIYDKNNENKSLNNHNQKEKDSILSETSSHNKNNGKEDSEKSLDSQKMNEKNIDNDDNKMDTKNESKLDSEILNKTEECLDNVNTNNTKHSRTSSISSSSNSLLINQSNFSELKFDDVFETPLLAENTDNIHNVDDKEKESEDTSHEHNSSEGQTPVLKCFDNLVTKPENISLKSELKYSSINDQSAFGTRSISRQSSSASCCTPPTVPPRTDLHSNNKFPNHQMTPPPLLPPPNSIIHHLPYGSLHSRHPHAPHVQPSLLPQHFSPYYSPYYSSSPCGYQDQAYADPIALRHRSNSHHRYWNTAYDSWYSVHDNQIYNQLPQVSGRPLDYSGSAYHHSPPMSDYFHHQGNRQFSTSSEGSTSSWQEYYHIQPPHNLQMIPSSSPHSSFIPQVPHQMQQTQISYTNVQNVEPENSSCDKQIPEANDNNSKSLNTQSHDFTNDSGDYKEPIPPLPNPQRRISSSSVLSGCSNKQNQILSTLSSSNTTLSTPITTSGVASTLRRSLSNSSSSIPAYPPPTLTNDHYYSLIQPNVYSNYEELPNKSLQHFAAFNMNMEQMIMKYQQQSSAPRNNSPLPPYDYPLNYMPGSMPYYHPQYSYQNPARIRTPHLNQPLDMTAGASTQGSLILPPHYGCGISTGSGSSSGYSSTISHMAMSMDNSGSNNSDNRSPGPWKTTQPLQQPRDVLWDNNNNSVISGKSVQSNELLFDDNFASISYDINNEFNGNQYDTVKRKQGEIKVNNDGIGNKVQSETEKKMESNYETKLESTESKQETLDQKESNPVLDSPEERNIFLAKDDPFEDDPFFKS